MNLEKAVKAFEASTPDALTSVCYGTLAFASGFGARLFFEDFSQTKSAITLVGLVGALHPYTQTTPPIINRINSGCINAVAYNLGIMAADITRYYK